MEQSVIRQIERNLTASAGLQSRPTDKASIRGIHQGQRSCEIAQKGRTHDSKRPLLITKKTLASRGPSTHEAALYPVPCFVLRSFTEFGHTLFIKTTANDLLLHFMARPL